MKTGEELKAALIKACQKAAIEMGGKIGGLSWFYRNSVNGSLPELKAAA